MAEKIALLDLEERFAKDKDKKELNKLLAELDGYMATTKKALDGGLAPEQFRNLSKYYEALKAARDVAPKVWAGAVNL